MNPAEAPGFGELLRANGKSESYVRVSKLLFNSIVGSEPHDFDLLECFAKTISEPFRRNPEIEPVMSGDEKFNRVIGRWGHAIGSSDHRVIGSFKSAPQFFSWVLDHPMVRSPDYPIYWVSQTSLSNHFRSSLSARGFREFQESSAKYRAVSRRVSI